MGSIPVAGAKSGLYLCSRPLFVKKIVLRISNICEEQLLGVVRSCIMINCTKHNFAKD